MRRNNTGHDSNCIELIPCFIINGDCMFNSFLVEKRKTICKMEKSVDCSVEFTSNLAAVNNIARATVFLDDFHSLCSSMHDC